MHSTSSSFLENAMGTSSQIYPFLYCSVFVTLCHTHTNSAAVIKKLNDIYISPNPPRGGCIRLTTSNLGLSLQFAQFVQLPTLTKQQTQQFLQLYQLQKARSFTITGIQLITVTTKLLIT